MRLKSEKNWPRSPTFSLRSPITRQPPSHRKRERPPVVPGRRLRQPGKSPSRQTKCRPASAKAQCRAHLAGFRVQVNQSESARYVAVVTACFLISWERTGRSIRRDSTHESSMGGYPSFKSGGQTAHGGWIFRSRPSPGRARGTRTAANQLGAKLLHDCDKDHIMTRQVVLTL